MAINQISFESSKMDVAPSVDCPLPIELKLTITADPCIMQMTDLHTFTKLILGGFFAHSVPNKLITGSEAC
jgi:hypothetical protein